MARNEVQRKTVYEIDPIGTILKIGATADVTSIFSSGEPVDTLGPDDLKKAARFVKGQAGKVVAKAVEARQARRDRKRYSVFKQRVKGGEVEDFEGEAREII